MESSDVTLAFSLLRTRSSLVEEIWKREKNVWAPEETVWRRCSGFVNVSKPSYWLPPAVSEVSPSPGVALWHCWRNKRWTSWLLKTPQTPWKFFIFPPHHQSVAKIIKAKDLTLKQTQMPVVFTHVEEGIQHHLHVCDCSTPKSPFWFINIYFSQLLSCSTLRWETFFIEVMFHKRKENQKRFPAVFTWRRPSTFSPIK